MHDFCPAVKTYCEKYNFEMKALLLLDNAPGHPVDLDSSSTGVKVEVVFLPPNTTSLLQLMDECAIAAFKAYYLRCTFPQLICDNDGKGPANQFEASGSLLTSRKPLKMSLRPGEKSQTTA